MAIKYDDKIQYALNDKTGKFEIVPADKLKRNAQGQLQLGKYQVDRGGVNASGFDWKSGYRVMMAPTAAGTIALTANIFNGVKGLFNKKESYDNVYGSAQIEASGFKKVKELMVRFITNYKTQLKRFNEQRVTDFSDIPEEDFKTQGNEYWFLRTDQDGKVKWFGTTQRVDGKDAIYGLDEKVGMEQKDLVNEFVTKPNASRELMRSQLNVGVLYRRVGDLNSISGILATNRQKIRLDQQKAEAEARQNAIRLQQQEAQRVAMLQANVSILATVRQLLFELLQEVLFNQRLQPGSPTSFAPARVVQPAINPQPVGGYAGPGNQLTYNGNLSVRNVTPQYNLRVR